MIGRKLAHYIITGKAGEGGMGVVYEALDSHLDRSVALKLLPHDALLDAARKQRFVQEAKTASALNHPNIVTIYDIASEDGVDYIAMELIRGSTLEQVLSRGRLPLKDALKWSVQIADALATAHAAGIVHRDLKPSNIMLNDRGDVKVLDFGLAKLSDATEISEEQETRTNRVVTEEGAILGSVPYMSPEQVEGRRLDARSDIFSFGSVLFEMLTGQRAFQGANSMATMAAILRDDPPPPSTIVPDLPPELERIVSRCLRKEFDRRSQSMAEIRVALQDLKEESASGTLRPAATAPPQARRKWPYWAGGALLAALAAASIVIFRPPSVAPALQARVLTSFVGTHDSPSLSPDGNQFAFAWDGDVPKGKRHIYISLVGKGTPLRLTPENEEALAPSWSPDGQSIAFVRQPDDAGHGELAVIPALGGAPHKVTQGYLANASWSPDSKWLVWSEQEGSGFFSLRIAPSVGGEPRKLFDHALAGKGDADASFSPDGRQIVFSHISADFDVDLFLATFHDGRGEGSPRQLTHDHHSKYNPLWTKDGKQIIFLEGEPESQVVVRRVPVSGGEPSTIEGIGDNATSFTLSTTRNRLLYSTESINYDIRRLDMRARGENEAKRFLSSTRYEVSPAYSPNGKRIAFQSNRSGSGQIWVADADGSNPVPLTSFDEGLAGSPKWSPDGQQIVFDARPGTSADIYSVPSAGGPVKRLTDYPGEDHNPSWSPDGKWIYFGSRRAGGHEVFRMHPDGSGVQQITHNDAVYGVVTPDGKWLYYGTRGHGLWKMPPDGGKASAVLPNDALYIGISFTLTVQGIYAVGIQGPEAYPILFYPFNGGPSRVITTLNRPVANFPGVSPDDRYLLYSIADDPVDEIMLVDNFR